MARAGEKTSIGRLILVAVAGLLVAVVVVRNAVVAQYAEIKPERAASVWGGHPTAELWLGLTRIGAAARERRPVGPAILDPIMDAARKAPLAAEPFLVRGVQAQMAGDQEVAERAFAAAELRDPRSIPARYFLAENAFRHGDAENGLREIAMLGRLVPGGTQGLAPYVAAYARQPSNWGHLRALFKTDPALQDAVLTSLASDARNAGLILGLWDRSRSGGQAPGWTAPLLKSLVDARQYGTAYKMWMTLGQVRPQPGSLIFDSAFKGSNAPGPFNWDLTSSTVGLTERQAPGRLHIIYYGQENGVLAGQLLLLKPGAYRLAMQLSGDAAHARPLTWRLTCHVSNKVIFEVSLADRAAFARGVQFSVAPDCPAQWLQLIASSPDLPQTIDVTVSNLSLTMVGANG